MSALRLKILLGTALMAAAVPATAQNRGRNAPATIAMGQSVQGEIVAPRAGYAGAPEYYAGNSALRFLPSIKVPTLVIHAKDDPWIPAETYRGFDWSAHGALRPVLPDRGGHVGFHAMGDHVAWHDRVIADFFIGQ